MHVRYTVSALLVFALALSASLTRQAGAQTPCVDGQADEFACDGIDLIANIPVSELTDDPVARGNDMWGWTDPMTNKEYALIGLTNGTVFIDVSTPTEPVILGTLPSELDNNCTWRDMKVYANYAFIVADCSTHPMQVFDLTRLRNVTNPPQTFDTDAVYTPVSQAHNIAINEEAGLAFPVGGSTGCSGGGLSIVDISDPLNPTGAGCYVDQQNAYVHDTQCVRYDGPDTNYSGDDICFNSHGSFGSSDFVSIVDVTDPSNPELINRVFYPNPGYTHQGWLTDDHSWFIADDETDSSSGGTRTFYLNVSDLMDPNYVYTKLGPTEATDHNLYILDGFMYQSNYEAGLRIWDVRTPDIEESVDEIAYFDTYPPSDNATFDGTWSNFPYFESGIIVVNDRDYGVFILQPTALPSGNNPNPTLPEALIVTLSGPNPADEHTSISINTPTDQEITVELIDAEGRVLQTVGSPFARAGLETTVSVDVHDLPAGTYFLRVRGKQEIVTKPIAVVR